MRVQTIAGLLAFCGLVAIFSLTMAACLAEKNEGVSPKGGDEPSRSGAVLRATTTAGSAAPQFQPRLTVIATGLEVPWALAFATRMPQQAQLPAASTHLFVTERPGRIRLVLDGQLQGKEIAALPVAASGEGGLLGLALDPAFEQNGYLYVMYSHYSERGELQNRVSRFTLRNGGVQDERVLVDGIQGASIHDGGRLKFGSDGTLYITTGTAQSDLSQRLNSLNGKILRVKGDGSIPSDNPFPGSPVYSYGHRNPQGLAWQPGTNRLFATEHGPSFGVDGTACCNDEINIIRSGGNYGWPVMYGMANDGRFVDPVLVSGSDTWAPSGASFYDANLMPAWRGNLFFGALRGLHLHRVVLGGPNQDQVASEERLFNGTLGRIRDVVAGPDGAIYVTTSNRDQRYAPGQNDDQILRVAP